MAKDCPEKKKTNSGEEKKETGMFVAICESIKTSGKVFEQTHKNNYAPIRTNNAKEEMIFVLCQMEQIYSLQIQEPQITS